MSKEERFEVFGENVIKDNELTPQLLNTYQTCVKLNEFNQKLAKLKVDNEALKQQNERVLYKLELMVDVDQENERLKEYNESLSNKFDKDSDMQNKIDILIINNKALEQQLKEKDIKISNLQQLYIIMEKHHTELCRELKQAKRKICDDLAMRIVEFSEDFEMSRDEILHWLEKYKYEINKENNNAKEDNN